MTAARAEAMLASRSAGLSVALGVVAASLGVRGEASILRRWGVSGLVQVAGAVWWSSVGAVRAPSRWWEAQRRRAEAADAVAWLEPCPGARAGGAFAVGFFLLHEARFGGLQ